NTISEVTFFWMVPRTRPASEFHSTWSPRLNSRAIARPSRNRPPSSLPACRCLLLNHGLQCLPTLQAGQHSAADREHRDPGNARLVVGVPQCSLVGLPVLPGPQGLCELGLVQPDLARQPRQHADVADVPA